MDTKIIFRRLGLGKHTYAVYHALQKNGALLPAEIAKATAIHRPAVYGALRDLLHHHFISPIVKGKRKFYHVTHPERIAQEFARTSEKVNVAVATLVSNDAYPEENIRLLKGCKGIREAFDDVVLHTPRGETFYRYTSEKDLNLVNGYLSKDYRVRRDAKKLERLVISNTQSGKQKRSRLERFIKYIPSAQHSFDQNIIQLVYGNRVTFIDLNSEKVMIIENNALAEFQKVIFRQLYRKL